VICKKRLEAAYVFTLISENSIMHFEPIIDVNCLIEEIPDEIESLVLMILLND